MYKQREVPGPKVVKPFELFGTYGIIFNRSMLLNFSYNDTERAMLALSFDIAASNS